MILDDSWVQFWTWFSRQNQWVRWPCQFWHMILPAAFGQSWNRVIRPKCRIGCRIDFSDLTGLSKRVWRCFDNSVDFAKSIDFDLSQSGFESTCELSRIGYCVVMGLSSSRFAHEAEPNLKSSLRFKHREGSNLNWTPTLAEYYLWKNWGPAVYRTVQKLILVELNSLQLSGNLNLMLARLFNGCKAMSKMRAYQATQRLGRSYNTKTKEYSN